MQDILKGIGYVLYIIALGVIGACIGAIFGAIGYMGMAFKNPSKKKEEKREHFEGL